MSFKPGPHNHGHDTISRSYIVATHDMILNRYEVLKLLCRGKNSKLYVVFDHRIQRQLVLRCFRNDKKCRRKAEAERAVLLKLDQLQKNGSRNIVKLIDYFRFRKHEFLIMERLSDSLHEVIQVRRIITHITLNYRTLWNVWSDVREWWNFPWSLVHYALLLTRA